MRVAPTSLAAGHITNKQSSAFTVAKVIDVVMKMKGGCQSHLVRCNDGNYYVAKFLNNPQGSRALINEWIAGSLIETLGIVTPHIAHLHVEEDLQAHPELYISIGARRLQIPSGLHFGSRVPVDFERTAMFDGLPERMLRKVHNLNDFGRILVVDKWLGQSDARQAIFYRNPSSKHLTVSFIDHGHAFGGDQWYFLDSANGLYGNKTVYSWIDLRRICEESVSLVLSMPERELWSLSDQIPETWFGPGDRAALQRTLSLLWRRRHRLASLLEPYTLGMSS